MESWPVPKTLRQLRAFLGFTGYYRRFVRGYAGIAAPLTNLLRKDAFSWNPLAQEAFEALKKAMVSTPVLMLPNFEDDFVVETDASNVGIGAVLMQKERPLAFFSKKLGPRLQAASTYTKELYAIVESIRKWRQYLLGRFFVVRTDHKSIRELFHQTIQTPEQQRYVSKLLGFHFRVEYRSGSSNKAADALSRLPEDNSDHCESLATFSAISVPQAELLDILRGENATKPDLLKFHLQHQANQLPDPYTVRDGLLFFRNRLVVSESSVLIPRLLHDAHATPAAGHGGVKRTLVRLATSFFWPKMRGTVERYVASCLTCQQTKYSTQPPSGLMQPLPPPAQVWEDLTMDFITGLPMSRHYTAILVVVDRLTKYAHFGPLPTQHTAFTVSTLFMDMVVKLHGMPASIVSDRDPIFLSKFWHHLFSLSGTKLRHSTAYHPQTDGQTEVVNRGLEQYLRAFTHDKPTTWSKLLGWAEFSYNSSYCSSIRMTPFQALYGRLPPYIPTYIRQSTDVQAVEDMLLERDALLRQLKINLRRAQNGMKQKNDKRRREIEFQVGDQVLVRLQPYRQISVSGRVAPKLGRRFYGPFTVIEQVGPVAYRLELPPTSRIHPVFHVSMLKPFKGDSSTVICALPPDSTAANPVAIPVAICARRQLLRKKGTRSQVLVQWWGEPPENATWEDLDAFKEAYPEVDLEDKVNSEEQGSDTIAASGEEQQVSGPNALAQSGEDVIQIPTGEGITQRPRRNTQKPTRLKDYVLE